MNTSDSPFAGVKPEKVTAEKPTLPTPPVEPRRSYEDKVKDAMKEFGLEATVAAVGLCPKCGIAAPGHWIGCPVYFVNGWLKAHPPPAHDPWGYDIG